MLPIIGFIADTLLWKRTTYSREQVCAGFTTQAHFGAMIFAAIYIYIILFYFIVVYFILFYCGVFYFILLGCILFYFIVQVYFILFYCALF